MTLPKHQRALLFLLAAGLLVLGGGFWWLLTQDSGIRFLPNRAPAQWIIYPSPPNACLFQTVELSTEFRRAFQLPAIPATARLSVCSFAHGAIILNGQPLGTPVRSGRNWKQPDEFDISRFLKPGTNEILVTVNNSNGPPALWLALQAGEFALNSDETWRASFADATWQPARLAATPLQPGPGDALHSGERSAAALWANLPLLLGFAVISLAVLAAGSWWRARCRRGQGKTAFGSPEACLKLALGGLAVAWVALWLNNLAQLNAFIGFDLSNHLAYINYIQTHRALPLANEGWEMYQPPLYYLLSAGELGLFHLSAYDGTGAFLLRLSGMLCGIATFTLVFLSLRLIFPNAWRQQLFGLLLAALLPANLYICHYVTNECLITTLAAACVYLCLCLLKNPQATLRQHALLGLGLGAALLAKTSAVVVLTVILVVLPWNLRAKGVREPRRWLQFFAVTLLCCLAVGGWHYARVAAHFGNPLVGNWDAASGFHWWQQEGYRTGGYYLSFGRSLDHPSFSAFNSFADGAYSTLWGDALWGGMVELRFRPPWDYDLQAAGSLLALLPTAVIIIGAVLAVVGFVRNPRPEWFLLLGLAFLTGTLLVYYSFKVPVYAAAKAFYGLGAMVPLCVFGALGWEWLARKAGALRLLLYLGLGVWALNVYASFWIRRDAPATRLSTAEFFSSENLHDRAAAELAEMLRRNPNNPDAVKTMAREQLYLGHPEAARNLAEKAVKLARDDADSHFFLATVLAQQGQLEQAIGQAKQTIALAPSHASAIISLAGWLARSSGRTQETIAACREGLRFDPVNPDLHRWLAEALASRDGKATGGIGQ